MYTSLSDAKDQLNIHSSVTSHDARLTRLIKAAEEWAREFLNVNSLEDLVTDSPASPIVLPEDVKSAILLHVEAEFDRDPLIFETIIKRAHDLLWPKRRSVGV